MTEKHSDTGASNCERWWNCAGSVSLIREARKKFGPGKSSEDSAKGTAVHKMSEIQLRDILNGTNEFSYFKGSKINADGFSFRVDQAMVDGMETYVEYVKHELEQEPHAQVTVEQRVKINDELWGQADLVVHVPFKYIHAIDYKNGYNEVPVEENKQGLFYALGAYLGLSQRARQELEQVIVTIVQPNGASGIKIKSWSCGIDYLNNFHSELLTRLEKTKIQSSPELNPGDWCRWCDAKPICLAFKNHVEKRDSFPLVSINKPNLPAPMALSPDQMFLLLDTIKPQMTAYFESVHQFAHGVMENGSEADKQAMANAGFSLTSRQGDREWIDVEKTKKFLMDANLHTLINIMTEPQLRSVPQIEKELKRLKIDTDISALYDRETKGTSLKLNKKANKDDFKCQIQAQPPQ